MMALLWNYIYHIAPILSSLISGIGTKHADIKDDLSLDEALELPEEPQVVLEE
jgi:hypothetical protein